MKYILKNTKHHNYFKAKHTWGFHCVLDKAEAYVFKTKEEVKEIIDGIKNKKDFKIIEVEEK